jgi:hypothetical protein
MLPRENTGETHTVAFEKIELDASGSAKGLAVDTKAAKVTNDKSQELFGFDIKPRDTVLRVRLERDAIFQHRW